MKKSGHKGSVFVPKAIFGAIFGMVLTVGFLVHAQTDGQEPPQPLDFQTLPSGHPPIGRSMAFHAPADDFALAAGVVVVETKAPAATSLDSLHASLIEWHQGQGWSYEIVDRRPLDSSGITRFEGISFQEGKTLSVAVDYEGVPHASSLFRLANDAGKRVRIQLFPLTTDMDRAQVGVRTFLLLEPRDHNIAVEQLFQFSNLSQETFRMTGIPIRLPAKAKGMTISPGQLSFKEVPGNGVILEGIVPPGVVESTLQYQLPYPNTNSLSLEFGMPPRVADLRIMAAFGPGLQMSVPELPRPKASFDEKGRRILVIQHTLQPSDDQVETLVVGIDGLPAKGHYRWIAMLFTFLLMAGGLVSSLIAPKHSPQSRHDLEEKRKSILKNVGQIEEERARRALSEATYLEQRDVLLRDLAEILEKIAKLPGDKDGDKQ
jgi:hypothetical protein